MLPNFLIIGTEKGGTTWLYEQLRAHPNVYLPPTKEPHFFNQYDSNLTSDTNWHRGLEYYRRLFRKHDGEAAVGEATPMYLCDPEAPGRIKETLDEVRLICLLRDPVDRAYSHYWMARRKGHTDESFDDVVAERDERFIERGRYGAQLERYLEWFPREFFGQPDEHLADICEFLQIDPEPVVTSNRLEESENSSSVIRSKYLHRLIGFVATKMRRTRGFDWLLDEVKRLGLADAIKDLNRSPEEYPEMSEAHRRELSVYYESTCERVESFLDRSVEVWGR
ncbi:MAG: sulfotransferase domain-containing protein [Bradymonadaceae bacterium]